jgi:hypothetical protein
MGKGVGIPQVVGTFSANNNYTVTGQYRIVKISGNREVALGGANEASFGVLQNKPAANGAAEVCVFGESKLIVGANWVAGNYITCDANGAGVPAVVANNTITYAIGQALDVGTVTEYARIHVNPGIVHV